MQTLQELGQAVATRRKSLGLKQGDVAAMSGVTPESLSRFERGRLPEFGTRKLLAVLAVLEAELDITASGQSGNLDELRLERAQAGMEHVSGKAAKSTPRARDPLQNSCESETAGSGWDARRLFAANSQPIGKKSNAADRLSAAARGLHGVLQRVPG